MIARFNIYVVWEITKLFVLSLVAFTTLMMLMGLVKQLVTQGLGILVILELIPYVLPEALQYALPATLLFAVCSVYGRISADNEVLSLMAAGVRPMRIIGPVLLASLMLSIVAVWINDLALSWGRPGMNRVVMHSIEQVAYGFLAREGSYETNDGLSIHVHGIGPDGRELISPTITMSPKGGGEPIEISARSARLTMDPVKEVLRIELVDSEVTHETFAISYPGRSAYEVSLSSATKKGTASGHPSGIPIKRIAAEKRTQSASINNIQEVLAARVAMGLGIGRYDWVDDSRTDFAIANVGAGERRMHRLNVEPWRRWALGFMCFFFVWVGIPLAIWMRSADHWTSFGSCFLPILLVYFPVFSVALDHSKDGSWPPLSVWLGNFVLMIVGAWWLRKIYR